MWLSSDRINTDILLWHEEVHRYYEEELYYYFIALSQFRPEWREDFTARLEGRAEDKKSPGIPGCGFCLYQIFGQYDVLLRIWLNRRTYNVFTDLIASDPNIIAIKSFQVTQGFRHWCLDELRNVRKEQVKKFLSTSGSDMIRDVQEDFSNGRDSKSLKTLSDQRLATFGERSLKNKEIKFYISITHPILGTSSLREDQIADDIVSICESFRQIKRRSFYRGRGEAWALLKGTTKANNYGVIGKLVLKIRTHIAPDGMRTATHLVMEPGIEGDYIADDSLKSPALQRGSHLLYWLPELEQETVLSPDELNTVVSLASKTDIPGCLRDDLEEDIIHEVLVSWITGKHERARRSLLGLFVDIEAELRDRFMIFLKALCKKTGESPNDVYIELLKKGVSQRGSEEGGRLLQKYLSLGEYVALYRAAFARFYGDDTPRPATDFLKQAGGDVTTFRNKMAHGQLKNLIGERGWEGIIEYLVGFFPKYKKFMEVISDASSEK